MLKRMWNAAPEGVFTALFVALALAFALAIGGCASGGISDKVWQCTKRVAATCAAPCAQCASCTAGAVKTCREAATRAP